MAFLLLPVFAASSPCKNSDPKHTSVLGDDVAGSRGVQMSLELGGGEPWLLRKLFTHIRFLIPEVK